MRLIIAGGRDFDDENSLVNKLNEIIKDVDASDITIISGGARGADAIGERIAKHNGLSLEVYKADWDKYGKSAGYKRNQQMGAVATHLLAAWDGRSKGTKHMIDIATNLGLTVYVLEY
jgi:hypothetical protein